MLLSSNEHERVLDRLTFSNSSQLTTPSSRIPSAGVCMRLHAGGAGLLGESDSTCLQLPTGLLSGKASANSSNLGGLPCPTKRLTMSVYPGRKFTLNRKAEKASNAEINRELAVISRAFNLGLEDGKIMMKPKVPKLRENNIRKGFFELDRFKAVRRNLPEDLQPVVTFAFLTGWRTRSEVQTLQWSQVNFENRRVYLEPGTTKNDDARWFPFTQELEGIILDQKRKTDDLKREKGVICPFVFHRNGKPIKSFYKA